MVLALRLGGAASRDGRQVGVGSRRVWLAAAAGSGASSTRGRVVRLLVSGVCTTRQPVRRGRWPSAMERRGPGTRPGLSVGNEGRSRGLRFVRTLGRQAYGGDGAGARYGRRRSRLRIFCWCV